MTGPEHYREAERDLKTANDSINDGTAAFYLASAQVHATLALTAAAALHSAPAAVTRAKWAGVAS